MSPRNRRTDVLRILGLARRAGGLALGTEAVRGGLRDGTVELVLLAEDGSPAQLDKVERLLRHTDVPWRRFGMRAELGAAVGGPPFTALGVTREGFAARLLEELGDSAGSHEGSTRTLEDDQTHAG
jgi:ribosomal protein L7Ae-like RNA K-turn-binding protein